MLDMGNRFASVVAAGQHFKSFAQRLHSLHNRSIFHLESISDGIVTKFNLEWLQEID